MSETARGEVPESDTTLERESRRWTRGEERDNAGQEEVMLEFETRTITDGSND